MKNKTLLLGLLCCETHSRETALRLTSHIQLQNWRRKGEQKVLVPILPPTFCSSNSLFTQWKVRITKMLPMLYAILRKNGFAHAIPLAWNVCFPCPRCLLGNLHFFKTKHKPGVANWIPNSIPSPSWRQPSSDSDTYLVPQDPGATGKAGPTPTHLNDDCDWFRIPG